MFNPIWHGGGDIFIPLSLLDQILSAEFFQKFPNFFGGENLHQWVFFWHHAQLIDSYNSCPLEALKMCIFLVFQRHARQG